MEKCTRWSIHKENLCALSWQDTWEARFQRFQGRNGSALMTICRRLQGCMYQPDRCQNATSSGYHRYRITTARMRNDAMTGLQSGRTTSWVPRRAMWTSQGPLWYHRVERTYFTILSPRTLEYCNGHWMKRWNQERLILTQRLRQIYSGVACFVVVHRIKYTDASILRHLFIEKQVCACSSNMWDCCCHY